MKYTFVQAFNLSWVEMLLLLCTQFQSCNLENKFLLSN